jgi:hypothetical protein
VGQEREGDDVQIGQGSYDSRFNPRDRLVSFFFAERTILVRKFVSLAEHVLCTNKGIERRHRLVYKSVNET